MDILLPGVKSAFFLLFFSPISSRTSRIIYFEGSTLAAKLKDYLQFQSFFFDVEQEFSSALRPAALGIISEPALVPVTFPVRLLIFFSYSILIPISLGTIFHSKKKTPFKKIQEKKACLVHENFNFAPRMRPNPQPIFRVIGDTNRYT